MNIRINLVLYYFSLGPSEKKSPEVPTKDKILHCAAGEQKVKMGIKRIERHSNCEFLF